MRYDWGMMNTWNHPLLGAGIGLLAIWSLIWKGLALWRAAKEENKGWFIALLIFNTAGILEIAYLFFFAKEKLTLATAPTKKSATKKSRSKK